MRITRITRQKRRPDRFSIYADGQFLAGVSAETLNRLALRTGDEVGDDQVSALRTTEELTGARNAALRLLGVRPRTVHEIRTRLREKEFSESGISRVVEDLTSSGLLNDGEFARAYIRNAATLRPIGATAIRRKLLLLGVDRETIEDALRETVDPASWEEHAERAARQYLTRRRLSGDPRSRRRLVEFLTRRGFEWDIVRAVISRLLKEHEDEPGRL